MSELNGKKRPSYTMHELTAGELRALTANVAARSKVTILLFADDEEGWQELVLETHQVIQEHAKSKETHQEVPTKDAELILWVKAKRPRPKQPPAPPEEPEKPPRMFPSLPEGFNGVTPLARTVAGIKMPPPPGSGERPD